MTPDVVARAFEPFFTTKPTGQGTGLGLSQVFGFVRQSGGFVRLRSKPAAGTTVCIYLPRDKKIQVTGIQTDDPSDTFAAVAPDPIEGKTVLVVEDEADVRTMIVDVLRDLGCCILEAGTGTAGLKLVQSGSQVDLLVTDIGLPGLNGRQLADAARESQPGLPVLLVTGYAGRALDDAAPAPRMEILRKPFAVEALVSRITALLRSNIQLPSVGTDS